MSEDGRVATTTDRVFLTLRESIVSGELAAGSQHSIYRLADWLDVSRTPVRDAVLRLADLGLVTIERNRGVRIRGVTVSDVQAVFELRLMVEVPAAAYAAANADDALVAKLTRELEQMRVAAESADAPAFGMHDRALHAAIGEVLGNARVQEELDRLRDVTDARGVSTMGRSRPMSAIAEEHAPVVEAIAARDSQAAAARMADHLEHTATLLMSQVAPAGTSIDTRWAERMRWLVSPRVQ